MAKDLNLSVTLKAINKATGPLKKIFQGSRGVGRAMKETRGELKDFNDQQRRIGAFRDMTRQSHATRDALREKRAELDRVTQELKSTTGPTRRLTQQQAKAEAAVDKLNREYRDQREQVRELARGLPRAEEGTRGLTAQQQALERKIRASNERLHAQRGALQRLGDADVAGRFNRMSGEARRMGRNVVLAGTLAAGSIFGLANSTADLGDDVGKTAAKLGLTNAELQELRYAGERSGVATATLDSSMVAFTKRLGEAADGTGAAVKGYEALGLNAERLAELPVAEAMREVADRMAEVENPTRRNAIAAQLYSRAGVGLVNMLKDGSSGLDDYARAARRTGYMLGDEATAGSEDFKDALLDTQLNLKGVKNTIGAELMPAVADMMRDLSGWLGENRARVQAFAKAFGDNLKAAVPVITDLARGTGRLASGIGEVVSRLAELVGGYDNLAMIAGGLFVSKLVLSVISLAVGIGKAIGAMAAFAKTLPIVATGVKALSAAFAATPIGWIVAGITAVALGAAYLWKHWDTIGPKFAALWESLKAMPGRAWAGIKAAFEDGIAGVSRLLLDWSPLGLLWRGITTALSALGVDLPAKFTTLGGFVIDGLIGGITAGLGRVGETIRGLGGSIIGWFKETLGINSPSRIFAGFGANLLEGLIGGIDEKWQALREKIGNTAGAVTNWFKEKLGINSPSRVFAELGGHTMDGYQQGLARNERGPLREVDTFAKRLRQAGGGLMLGAATVAGAGTAVADSGPLSAPRFDARAPLTAPAAGGANITIGDINVHAAPGMDEQALARLVAAEVQRALAAASHDDAARQRSALHDID